MAKDKPTRKRRTRTLDGEGAEGEGAQAKKKLPLMLIIAGAAALVLVLGGGGDRGLSSCSAQAHAGRRARAAKAKKAAKKDGDKKDDKNGAQVSDGPDGVVFYTLPDIVVNMQTADGKPTFLKLKLTFELPDHDTADALEPNMPRLQDMFQTFLRELRPEDLSGSQGTYQLRMEILRRVNLVIAPVQGQRRPDRGDADQLAPRSRRCDRTRHGRRTRRPRHRRRPPPPPAAPPATDAADWGDDGDGRPPSASSTRTRSTACWASTSPTTTAPSAPASARSSTRRWSPTSACRCWRSSSTAWCG